MLRRLISGKSKESSMVPLSIQLYTVREMAAKDFVGVLKKIAAVGFKGVEFAGLHGMAPKDVRKVIDDLGMVASSAHCPMVTKENLSESLDIARTLGYTMLISGRKADAFKTAADIAKTAADYEAAAALMPKGFTVGYHNHAWEFDKVDGRLAMDLFLEKAPSIFSQVDVYWASNFGAVDPAAFVKKHQKRIPILHLKDGPLVKDKKHTALGKGKVNIPACLAAADPKLLQWAVFEMDGCDTDILTAVADSYQYMITEKLAAGRK
jgi:sugar phosphate isomerase/epimerase